MALNGTVESIDGLTEQEAAHYKRGDDGKFHLEVITGQGDQAKTRTVHALVRATADVLTEKRDAVAALNGYKEALGDMTPAQVKALKDAGGDTTKVEARVAAAVAEVRKLEVEPLKLKLDATSGQLTKRTRDDAVREKLTKAGVIPDRLADALALALPHVHVKDDGESLYLKDADGNPRVIDVDRWVAEEYKAARPYFFAASQAGGAGATAETKPGTPGEVKTVKAGDNRAFGNDLDAIAAGTVKVVVPVAK